MLDAPITSGLYCVKIVVHPEAPKWFGPQVKDVMNRFGSDYEIEQSTLGGTISGLSIAIG